MKVVRGCTTALLLTLLSTEVANAQLPGLPSPWQTGVGYFVGPYGSGVGATNLGSGVFCTDLKYVLQYGYTWSAFLTPVGSNNATPTGYSYNGIGGQCGSSGPNAFSPYGATNIPYLNSSNPLYIPPTPPGQLGPSPHIAAFHFLPTAPPSNPPPNDPPGEDPPVITPPVLEPHVTPEPATWLLLGTGLVAILGFAALKSTRF
jgi:hypothetical protein